MSFKFVKQLPSPEEIKEMSPVTEEMKKVKETRDRLIQDVITGNSDKFLVIVGPCSADNEEAVCDYTNRLAKVQEKVAARLVISCCHCTSFNLFHLFRRDYNRLRMITQWSQIYEISVRINQRLF